jgi:hypothetical protein
MISIDILNAHENFEQQALEIFYFQALENEVYKNYLKHLNIDPLSIDALENIPFLPISFFKSKKILSTDLPIQRVFKSSGTGLQRSSHYIVDSQVYISSFVENFERTYGALEEICILALLPNYQENPHSSLLFMMDELITRTEQNGSQYLNLDQKELRNFLKKANKSELRTILIGVSFALLDLAEMGALDLSKLIILETGGMKGRRKEITREALHQVLGQNFQQQKIHSEYGMCELLSQAYSKGDGIFQAPAWMKVMTRPIQEPYSAMEIGKAGIVKIVDLANIYSCSFIETEDIGVVQNDGTFEILGRADHTQLRGCNLMHV